MDAALHTSYQMCTYELDNTYIVASSTKLSITRLSNGAKSVFQGSNCVYFHFVSIFSYGHLAAD